MRVTEISVKKLFRLFDYKIPLNQEDRITLVHGPNGIGKTNLLRMLQGLFNEDYSFLEKIPFQRFEIQFDNKKILSVKKLKLRDGENSPEIEVFLENQKRGKERPFSLKDKFFSKKEKRNMIRTHFPEYIQVVFHREENSLQMWHRLLFC